MQQSNQDKIGIFRRAFRRLTGRSHAAQDASEPRRTITLANEILIPEIVKLMDEGHTITLRLKGFSMRPFLEDNRDKALLTKAHDPKVGDPVLAETAPKHYVLHRIIKIEGDNVTLRGDGNLGEEHCTLVDVKGAVIGFYRKGRKTLDRTDGRKWRVYSFVWTRLYPIRRYLLAFYRRIWIPLFGVV
jgi:hypothetical protein